MAFFRKIVSLGRRARMEREIEAELREHMAMCIDDNMAQGMSREEAERDARRRFGNPAAMRERVAAEDSALGLESLWHDVCGSLRVFHRSPGFCLVVIVILALGLGANTAIFEILNAVRLRTLPIARPGELVEIRIADGTAIRQTGIGIVGNAFTDFTVPMWREIKEHHDPLSGIFAWGAGPALLGPPGQSYQANAMEVSGEFFNVLGVTPVQGRLIGPQDEAACQLSGVVVSYPFWKSHMGGEPITSKSTIVAGGQPLQVVGVTSPSFFGMVVGDRFDVAYTTCRNPNRHTENFVYTVMGRLKPGWTLKQAADYFDALSPGLFQKTAPMGYSAEALKTWKALRLAVYPAGAGVSYLRDQYNSSLEILLAITGLVLLIACANLANLMLARASVKRREVAIRMSLGASRGRLLRQILLESALLAACGAIVGAVIAQPLSRSLVNSLNTSQNTIQLTIAPDWRVLLFAAAAGIATCVIFGTLPALRSSSAEPLTSLKSGERGVVGNRERFSAQRALVIAQIAVSMVLLVGALLFIRSYRSLLTLNPGIRESNITIGFLNPNVKPESLGYFKRQLVAAVRAIPGVENAATSTFIPLSGGGWIHDIEVGAIGGSSNFSYVSPTFFETLGIPVLEGRNFTDYDTMDKPLVVVVNEAFVRKYVGARSPLGVQVRVHPEPGFPARTCQIIAVVPDTRYSDLRATPPPQAFAPMDQLPAMAPIGWGILIASRDPVAAQSAILRMLDAQFPGTQSQFSDFQQGILDHLVGDRMMARLAGFFGVLAALLVAVGLHGLLSYFVAQRRGEIAIRMALGADRGRVVGEMLRGACIMLVAGLAAGTAVALLAGREATTLLFGLKPWDPTTVASAAALLALVTIIASVVPSLRAANVNPVEVLRAE